MTVSYNNDNGFFLCSETLQLTVAEPTALMATSARVDPTCDATTDGTLTLTATGGTGPYAYAWNTGDTTATLGGLGAGQFAATVTDANGCTTTVLDTLTAPAALTLTAALNRAGCTTADDGSIVPNVTGGTGPYTYAWSTGATTPTLTGLAAGSYDLVVTDANGCMADESFALDAAPEPFTALYLAASGLQNLDTVEVNASDLIQFKDVSFPDPTEWLWEFGDPANSTATGPEPAFSYPNDPGVPKSAYFAKLTVSNQFCTDSLTKPIYITNNMRLIAPQLDTAVYLQLTKVIGYPNPTTDGVTVLIEMNRAETVTVDLLTPNGQVLAQQTLTGAASYSPRFELGGYPAGAYTLRVRADTRVHALHVVKVR